MSIALLSVDERFLLHHVFSYSSIAETKTKECFYVRWTAQSALHFSSPRRPVHSGTNLTSRGSVLAMQHLRNDYSLTCPPLSVARYSFIQLSRLRRREENENAQTSKVLSFSFEFGHYFSFRLVLFVHICIFFSLPLVCVLRLRILMELP